MRRVAPFFAIAIFCSASALLGQADSRKITVLVDFERPHSDIAIAALRQELVELLTPARVDVELVLKSDLPPMPEFGELVVFKMKGACSLTSPPPVPAFSAQPGPLAVTYSSDGQILHFGAVECDRIRQCLQRVSGLGNSERQQQSFGAALGIVMAHEVYHMVLGAARHTKEGVTKESLSPRDLIDGVLTLPASVSESMRQNFNGPSH